VEPTALDKPSDQLFSLTHSSRPAKRLHKGVSMAVQFGWLIPVVAAAVTWALLLHPTHAQAPTSVSYIFSNGDLEWRSWSWGLRQLNLQDTEKAMPGARAAMCLSVQPFGALSLKAGVRAAGLRPPALAPHPLLAVRGASELL
jgi:hypothetical protein